MKFLFIASLLSSFLLADAQKIIESFQKTDACMATLPVKYTGGASFSNKIFPEGIDVSKIQNFCTTEEIGILSVISECLSQKVCQWAPEMNRFIEIGLADPAKHIFEPSPSLSLESCMKHSDALSQSSSCQKAFSGV